ncbi:MAG: response regulator [Chloroflexi bacterium]|nr:response regulator [Chloroflexota bacterium]
MKPEALIIEDDAAQCEIFSAAVHQAGYNVTCLSDGAQALEYLKQHTVALVVLDLHLPGLGGEHIARAMRSMPHLKATRLILASADDRLAGMISELADLVLLKPISFIQLRDLATRLRAKGDFSAP